MNQYSDKQDDVLVELTLLGTQEAYAELVTRHERAVKGTAYKVTGNLYSAEDASQDAFVSAWMHLDSLRDRSKFGSWVCSIAKNCARSIAVHYRSHAGDISLNLLENTELTASDESGLAELTDIVGISEQERDERLRHAVDALSEKIRETVRLHYFDGLSVAQIAEKLSLPAGTVKWRLSEGRKQLRKEYGVMEKTTYNENESMVSRVMRRVEELKLWCLRNDMTGFEKEYRAVLESVENLDESAEKQHALADVLLRGYWWVPGERNDEMLARIKEAALLSHNEDVMQSVAANEHGKFSGKELIDFMLNTQIPFYAGQGLVKTQAYVWFWLGHTYFCEEQFDESLAAFRKVLELLKLEDVYYANALAAIRLTEKIRDTGAEESMTGGGAMGEEYRRINGKLCMWLQPGYTVGYLDDKNDSFFWQCSQCDSLIYDPEMKVGDVLVSSDKKMTLTYKEAGVTVETPAGVFENCSVYVLEGERHGLKFTETAFCPNVGIVRQRVERNSGLHDWRLAAYTVNGGEGLIPFAAGNRWEYSLCDEDSGGMTVDARESIYEVTSYENDTAVLYHYSFCHASGYDTESWAGNILKAKDEYSTHGKDGEWKLVGGAVEALERAVGLAATPRQKRHSAAALDVMKRIFATDPDYNPDFTEKGRWNFFDSDGIRSEDGRILFADSPVRSFEWKDMGNCGDEGYPVLHNFLYDILCDAAGCIWSDEWVPGYRTEEEREKYGEKICLSLRVPDDETVTTPAGTFENCRRISIDLQGMRDGWAYRGGKKDYWFAPGVGIVKMRALYKDDTLEGVWELTSYEGVGEGYFPVKDGLFRRYEAMGLTNGWHGAVEYMFDEENGSFIMIRNALGTQDRADWEAGQNK